MSQKELVKTSSSCSCCQQYKVATCEGRSRPQEPRLWIQRNKFKIFSHKVKINLGAMVPLTLGKPIEVASVIELSEASGWVAAGLFMTEG